MRYQVRCAGMPLAIYYEVAAHIRQVDGVETALIPQASQQFDYGLSQVHSLQVEYSELADSQCAEQVQHILAYYGDRYGTWETIEVSAEL